MKKSILKLFIVFVISLIAINNVYAYEITMADDDVVQEGEYDSVRLVAGNKVTNKAHIDGLSFAAGNMLYLEGSAPYGFFAGNSLTINENIEKDMFAAGNEIVIDSDAMIGRDIYLAGNKITIKANINRDLRVGCNEIDLSGVTVNGDAYIYADRIIFDENTIINGKLTYPEDSKIKGFAAAIIGETKVVKNKEIKITNNFKTQLYSFLLSIVSAFATLVILFFILPNSEKKLQELDLSFGMIAKTACIGFVVLIASPIVIIMAMMTGILTPVSFIALALYIVGIYLSSLLVYYIVGDVIDKKLIHKENKYLSMIIGIILIKLIKLIPIIGGYISAVIIFYGLGLIFNYIKERK